MWSKRNWSGSERSEAAEKAVMSSFSTSSVREVFPLLLLAHGTMRRSALLGLSSLRQFSCRCQRLPSLMYLPPRQGQEVLKIACFLPGMVGAGPIHGRLGRAIGVGSTSILSKSFGQY